MVEPSARIYLDHGASTPCDPAVAALMEHVEVHQFANPSSAHRAGQHAARYIETARERLAAAVGALPEEIVFTSGATESNNLAILGIVTAAEERGESRRRIVTLGIEHPSVLGPCRHLAKRGFELVTAPVHRDGTVDLDALKARLGDETLLLSIQAANNEIGTIQPLAAAAHLAHERGALVHSDAAQSLGKIPFDVETLQLDFASFSAHKCYGPKGVGALWVCGGPLRAPIAPLWFGGGHERGLRPGTSNTAAIAGFGEAVRLAAQQLAADAQTASRLARPVRSSASRPDRERHRERSSRQPPARRQLSDLRRCRCRCSDRPSSRSRPLSRIGLSFRHSRAVARPTCNRTRR